MSTRTHRRSGTLVLVVALAAFAAFILVPAAQAFAEEAHLKVNMVGTGSGEVKSQEVPGVLGPGTPPIECSYNGTTKSGACKTFPVWSKKNRASTARSYMPSLPPAPNSSAGRSKRVLTRENVRAPSLKKAAFTGVFASSSVKKVKGSNGK